MKAIISVRIWANMASVEGEGWAEAGADGGRVAVGVVDSRTSSCLLCEVLAGSDWGMDSTLSRSEETCCTTLTSLGEGGGGEGVGGGGEGAGVDTGDD